MKKLLFSAIVLISINTYAQKVRFGISGGAAIANYQIKVGGETESVNSIAGFTGGIVVDIPGDHPRYKHFSFQPAINFVQKGTKNEETFNGVTEKFKLTVNHIEMPLNFLYNSRGKAVNIFIGGGPSVAVALSGKVKYNDGTNKLSEDIKFGNGDDKIMTRGDLGANLIAGFSLNNGLLFSLNYNAGLINLISNSTDGASLRGNYLGIRLGYMFR